MRNPKIGYDFTALTVSVKLASFTNNLSIYINIYTGILIRHGL